MISGETQRRTSPVASTSKRMRVPQVPIEWLDAGAWRLPSGKALAEFALQAGFLAPLLFEGDAIKRSMGGFPAGRRIRRRAD